MSSPEFISLGPPGVSESKPSLKIEVSADRTQLKLTISGSDTISFNGKMLGELVRILAQVRGGMLPVDGQTVPKPGYQMLTSPLSRWYVEPRKDDPGAIAVAVFHPGTGWTGMVLDREKASHLRDIIEYWAKLTPTH